MRIWRKFQKSDTSSALAEQKLVGSCPAAKDATVQTLASNEILFRAGDPKTHFFRVERGTICVYKPQWTANRTVVEFAFPGDLIGLGYLETHICTARSMVEAQVTRLPLSSVDKIVDADPRARDRLKQAIDREVDFVRDSLVKSGRESPVERVAAFLVALSRNNKSEGRDPSIITDSMQCGVVATYLSLSVDALGELLAELEKRGLIEPHPSRGLRLKDLNALELLAGSGH
jgi:CRP/FNR family transcriptional regulator, anaerobic regulatory protein